MTEAQLITDLIGVGGLVITFLVLCTAFKFEGQ